MFKKAISFLVAVLLLSGMAITLSACGSSDAASITVIGSTSVEPLAQELADAYEESLKSTEKTGLRIDVQGVGSTAGIKAVYDKTCDIGTSSRDLKDEEKEWGLTEHIIAIDGIAVIVNPANTVSDLTKEQITSIFKGEITNWKDLGGADKEILVISREDGSGTRGAFDELLKIVVKENDKEVSYLVDDALIAEGSGTVKSNVASKENAIGYISLGIVDESVKAVSVNGTAATVENVKAGAYAVSRPFIMLTGAEIGEEVQAFLDFILSSEGQEIVSNDYITIN